MTATPRPPSAPVSAKANARSDSIWLVAEWSGWKKRLRKMTRMGPSVGAQPLPVQDSQRHATPLHDNLGAEFAALHGARCTLLIALPGVDGHDNALAVVDHHPAHQRPARGPCHVGR